MSHYSHGQEGYGGGYGAPPSEGYGGGSYGGEYQRQGGHGGQGAPPVQGQVVRVFSKAKPDFYLTAFDDGSVGLSQGNVSNPHQEWVMDESWGEKLTDSAGSKAFALVNKATGLALRHGNSENEQVTLSRYNRNELEDDLLWTNSEDMGHGFHTVRAYNNIHLNLDADHGDKKHGGIKEGNKLVLFKWQKQDNQQWKIVPV